MRNQELVSSTLVDLKNYRETINCSISLPNGRSKDVSLVRTFCINKSGVVPVVLTILGLFAGGSSIDAFKSSGSAATGPRSGREDLSYGLLLKRRELGGSGIFSRESSKLWMLPKGESSVVGEKFAEGRSHSGKLDSSPSTSVSSSFTSSKSLSKPIPLSFDSKIVE